MPFFVENKSYELNLKNILQNSDLNQRNQCLLGLADSPRIFLSNENLLYVHQSEMATLCIHRQNNNYFKNSVQYLGSDDATTCHIAVLVCTDSSNNFENAPKHAISIGHIDSEDCVRAFLQKSMSYFIAEFQETSNLCMNIYVIGGFDDARNESIQISEAFVAGLRTLQQDNSQLELHFKQCCIFAQNTFLAGSTNFPKIYGIFFDCLSFDFGPANFSDEARGPEYLVRSSRFCCPNSSCIYWLNDPELLKQHLENENQLALVFEAYNVRRGPLEYQRLSQMPDSYLRRFSTSPDQEKPDYANKIRSIFTFLSQNHPLSSTVFENKSALVYVFKRSDTTATTAESGWTRDL